MWVVVVGGWVVGGWWVHVDACGWWWWWVSPRAPGELLCQQVGVHSATTPQLTCPGCSAQRAHRAACGSQSLRGKATWVWGYRPPAGSRWLASTAAVDATAAVQTGGETHIRPVGGSPRQG